MHVISQNRALARNALTFVRSSGEEMLSNWDGARASRMCSENRVLAWSIRIFLLKNRALAWSVLTFALNKDNNKNNTPETTIFSKIHQIVPDPMKICVGAAVNCLGIGAQARVHDSKCCSRLCLQFKVLVVASCLGRCWLEVSLLRRELVSVALIPVESALPPKPHLSNPGTSWSVLVGPYCICVYGVYR